jgi:hypothetical protein
LGEFAEQEFASIDLGDKRREKRFRSLMDRLLQSPMKSIKSACRGWAECMAAYRLLNNSALTAEAIFAPHREALLQRAKEHSCVLVIQDTTELDYTAKKGLEGAGPLNDDTRRGFLMHSQFVVSEDRLPLGVLYSDIFSRDDEDFRAKRKQLPIEEKESYRWLEGYLQSCELKAKLLEVEVVSMSDREGDIYEVPECWHLRSSQGLPVAEWIIRANQNRVLLREDSEPQGEAAQTLRLFEEVKSAEILGHVEFEVTTRDRYQKIRGKRVKTHRSARRVRQRIRACKVSPRPPYRKGKKLAPVSFWIVLAEEIDPPANEEPISWMLLTSIPVNSFEDAKKVIQRYLGRWDIEVFHRVLKSGCKVEEIQLKTQEALIRCLAVYLIVAWRILYLTHLGRQCPDLPCGVVFEEAEWKSALAIARPSKKQEGVLKEPTLAEMIQIVAEFGGHLGRKGDGAPGAQCIWQGLSRVRDFAIAWIAFGKEAT